MPANTSILLANPDFFSIKQSLKLNLQDQVQFRDYNFDGSNLNALLDVLATNTYQGAFMKNMLASEMFLGTSQLSNSIYSHAKELTYVPRSAKSASTTLTLEITTPNQPSVVIVPKGTLFTGTAGARSLAFSTSQAYTLERTPAGIYAGDVVIYEGLYVTDVYTVTTKDRFTINNRNVDTESLEVTVTDNTGTTIFTKQDSIIGLQSSTSPVFYISVNYKGLFEIYFGDNIVGATPSTGSVINIRYRVTSADLGNDVGQFRNSANISGYTGVRVITQTLTAGGAAIENAEITRKYAPLANQIRDRAFTEDDYIILLRQAFPEIRAINVFGGETLDPPQFGKIVLSITTDNSLNGISNNLKDKYTKFVNSKNPTIITPIFINPELIQVKVNAKVYYDFTKTTLTENDIHNKVTQAIQVYNLSQLNNFNTILRKSKLTGVIDSADASINSNETALQLTTIIDHAQLRTRSKTIRLYNEIARCTRLNDPSIYSTTFKYNNAVCRIVDTTSGKLFIETILNGVRANIIQVGTIDYLNGVIVITPFDIQDVYTSNLNVFIYLSNDDIQASRNTLIQIDLSELQITSQAQKR